MKIMLTVTAAILIIMSSSANAWWNNSNNRNNWSNNGYYDNRYDARGDTRGDGALGFHGDFRFKVKMRGKGDSRVDAYNYGNWNNGWDNGWYNAYYNNNDGRYYYDSGQSYNAPYYGPGYRMQQPSAPVR